MLRSLHRATLFAKSLGLGSGSVRSLPSCEGGSLAVFLDLSRDRIGSSDCSGPFLSPVAVLNVILNCFDESF